MTSELSVPRLLKPDFLTIRFGLQDCLPLPLLSLSSGLLEQQGLIWLVILWIGVLVRPGLGVALDITLTGLALVFNLDRLALHFAHLLLLK